MFTRFQYMPELAVLFSPRVLSGWWIVARLDRKRLGHDTFTTKWNWIRGVFDEQTRRKPLVFAADAVRYVSYLNPSSSPHE